MELNSGQRNIDTIETRRAGKCLAGSMKMMECNERVIAEERRWFFGCAIGFVWRLEGQLGGPATAT